MNFQGRLLTDTGGLVPDGSYNIEFNLYTVDSGGASLWTEARTGAAAVTVSNGYYSVYLGDVTAFPTTIPWDQDLWLGMNVNSDGEMTPRFKLTAVPYAFRAGAILDSSGNAYTGDDLAQLAPTTIQPVTAAIAALRINQAGTGGLLQLQGGGTDVFTVDNTGAVTAGAGVTVGNSTSTTAGTIRWNGTDLEAFNGTAWVSLTSGGSGGGGSGTTVIKTTDESVTSSNVLQDDDELAFPITANETTTFRFTVHAQSNTLPDFRFAVTAPFGAVCTVGVYEAEGQTGTGNLGCGAVSGRIAGSNGNEVYEITGLIENGPNAGNVTLQWAQFTTDASTSTVRAGSFVFANTGSSGGSGSGTSFEQGGNSFGATATLGTTDPFGLDIITNGSTAASFTSAGALTLDNGLTLSSGNLDLTAGEIQNTGNITGAGALTIASGGANDLTLDSGSGVLNIADGTVRRTAAGATTLDLLDAAGTTTLSLLNSDVTQVAGLTVEGDVTANAFNGDGSALTALNGTNITSGTIADARLSTNIALLDTAQTFTARPSFGAGLNVGNTADTTAGNIRWSGTDFEGFDGTAWQSLTTSPPTTPSDYISETINNNSTASAAPYDVFDAANYGTFSSTTNASNGIVFTSADGRFTVPSDGPYNINASLMLQSSTSSLMNIIVRVNGVNVYNHDTFIHTAVDPVERSVTVVQDLSANDFVEILVDGTGSITVHGGSTANIVPVSSAGGGGGGGGGGTTFDQGGNAFGGTALLGTTDTNGLDIIIDTVAALQFTSAGAATFNNGLAISSGDLSLSGGNITNTGAFTVSSGGAGDLTLDSASDTVILNDSTLQRSGAGTTTIDLFDASGGTTLSLLNSDAGQIAGLLVEGDVVANTLAGDGSAITNLNGTTITSGTIADARLSTNIALLDTDQTFTGQPTFNSGVVLGNTATATAGAVRWTGTDFEGFDGTDWVSLSDGGGDTINVVKTADETINTLNALQNDDHLFFDVDANQTWSFDFVLQAQSGTTPDFRFAVTAPGGAVCAVGAYETEGATGTGNLGCGVSSTRLSGTNVNEVYRISGTVITGATAGQVTLQWAQFTSNAASTIVRAGSFVQAVEENGGSGGGSGGGGSGTSFDQGGNAFGSGGILGTTDGFGLDIVTGGTTALAFTSAGAATLNNGLTISAGDLSVDSGVIDAVAGLTISSGGSGDLSLDSASDTLVLNDATLQRVAAGTTIIDLNDSSGGTTLSLINSDGSQAAGLTVEGDVSASSLSGDGSGLTGLNGSAIISGTIPNARLSATVALTDTAQTFTGIPTFSSGLIAGGSTSTTAGAIRWSGADLEGFDGVSWVSLTGGGGASGTSGDFISETIINNSNASAAPYDVFEAGNYGAFSSTNNAGSGIVFTSADGRFTVPNDGTYNINASLMLQNSNVSLLNIIVRVNGADVYNNDTFIHSAVDPVERTVTIVQDLSANDYVEVLVDGTTGNITTHGGSTINIVPVSAVGGGGAPTAFLDGGNAFGTSAVLGTTDTFGLSIITDGAASIIVSAAGEATFSNDTFFNGKLTLGSPSAPDALAQAVLYSGATTNKGLVVQGVTSQSANLLEIQDNTGATLSGFDASGSLVLGQSTVDSAATASQTITLPDASGTICLSGGDCGFLELASGATYVDATSDDVLSINKTSGTGELLDFQRSSAPVFTVANTGALQIQATSSTSLDIRNVGGTSFFTVDTSSGEVRVGPATADANGVLFVLDTKNTAGDPAGVDGAQYYNSSLGKFRCFEGGIWVDCINTDKTPQVRSFVDTSTDPLVNADGTDYWDTGAENNNSVPNVTPSDVSRSILGTVSVEFDTTSNGDRDSVVRVERAVGAAPVCGAGTIVGGKIGVFTSQNGARKTGTVTFLDEPATTSDVYYTVCSDADTSNANNISIPRIRVTLQEVENSN